MVQYHGLRKKQPALIKRKKVGGAGFFFGRGRVVVVVLLGVNKSGTVSVVALVVAVWSETEDWVGVFGCLGVRTKRTHFFFFLVTSTWKKSFSLVSCFLVFSVTFSKVEGDGEGEA
jgi:hypothetical protein